MTRLWKAFLNTLYGLGWALRHEQAVREEFAVLAVALPLSFFVAASPGWWLALMGSLLALLIVELLNTAIEKLADRLTTDHDPQIGRVKDMGSAAVGVALVMAGLFWLFAIAERMGAI